MKKVMTFFIVLVTSGLLTISSGARATCDLLQAKYQNFAGLELIRACSISNPPPEGFPNLCELVCAGEPSPCDVPQEPLVNLMAHDMLYFNWEIPPENIAAFESALGFEVRGFHLAPIEIVQGERPRYYLSLNFYKTMVAGVATIRSEWSVYVTKTGDPKPRYMVIEIFSSENTVDPTQDDFINEAVNVLYEQTGNALAVVNPTFSASLSITPGYSEASKGNGSLPGKKVMVAKSWAEANDALYYVNGVADTALYNGLLTNSPLVSINPNLIQIDNSSSWANFVAEKPTNVLMFQQPLEFAFTPYFNLSDSTIGLPPEYLAVLQSVKTATFGAFSHGHALLVLQGLEQPIVRFDVIDNRVPSIFINFNIPEKQAKELERDLRLPSHLTLARSRMTDTQPLRYMMTLNIYETLDVLSGAPVLRAEWSVYVRDVSDVSADNYYFMVIDVNSNSPSLDPYNGTTPPTGFSYANNGGFLEASILNLDMSSKFSIEFENVEQRRGARLDEQWILSNDRIYWRNGVYDRLLYNGSLLSAHVTEIDPSSAVIVDASPWARYVDKSPLQLAVFGNPLQFVINPWYNAEQLCFGP
ncbi:hypothetical protein ACPV4B_20320 [Vibrio parahaemolyticus]|uniref:hypothetical protein n=1 Tax=Vibrio mediterranei TaxID=689 RepID=UPI004068DE52